MTPDADYMRAYRARAAASAKAYNARNKVQARARWAAYRRLREEHPDRWAELYAEEREAAGL